jgi:HEAT repeat protein
LTLALILILVGTATYGNEPFAFDPVAELRQALRTPVADTSFRSPDLQQRRANLNRCVAQLCQVPELREALLLREWQTEGVQEYVALIDQAAHAVIARRFEQAVLDILQRGDHASRLAAVNMLTEMGARLRDTCIPGWSMRGFTAALADLACGQDPALCEAVVRALGQINADPALAVPALAQLGQAREPFLRRVAAGGVLDLVQAAGQGLYRRPGTPGQTSRLDVLMLSRLAIPAASAGLRDPDGEVRRLSMETLHQTVAVVRKLISDPALSSQDQSVTNEDAALMAVARALKEQTAGLATALQDPDARVRLSVHQTLEEIGAVWTRLEGRDGGAAGGVVQAAAFTDNGGWVEPTPWTAGPLAALSLRQRLHTALPSLAASVADPDVRVRKAAIEALEVLGPDAAPAAPALVRALADRDVFVRWAAARTLGKMAPAQAALAVPGLQALLRDRDLDVRLAAAAALKQFGPAARSALPALMEAVQRGDPTVRLAALEVLEGIGPETQAAIPVIAAALQTPDVRVRKAAARLLGRFGPLALDARENLRVAMLDGDPEVRRTASDALLYVGPPPTPAAIVRMSEPFPPPAPATSANRPPVIWRAAHTTPAPAELPRPAPASPAPPPQPPTWRSPQTNSPAPVRLLAPTVWHAAPLPPPPQLVQAP